MAPIYRNETAPGVRRLPVIGVLGGGAEPLAEPVDRLAAELGAVIADLGAHLLTGGGGGVMASACRGFVSHPHRRGLAIGVLPAAGSGGELVASPPEGYPNPYVELVIATHLPLRGERGADPLSRNHLNILSSDVLLALPGGAGTATEVELAKRYDRPCLELVVAPGTVGSELRRATYFLRSAVDEIVRADREGWP